MKKDEKTTTEYTMAHSCFSTVKTKTWQEPQSSHRIQMVRPLYEKVQVPSRIFSFNIHSAGGILLVVIIIISSEGAEEIEALGHTSSCHQISTGSLVLLIQEDS